MSNSRYVIYIPLPDYIKTVVGAAYERVTGRELPVTQLHTSMVFPFYLHEGYGEDWLEEIVAKLRFTPIAAHLGQVSVYRQGAKQILHILLEPSHAFRRLHSELLALLRGGVVFDTSIFVDERLPPFEAHVSLDYAFDGDRTTLRGLEEEQIEGFFQVDQLRIARLTDNGLRLN